MAFAWAVVATALAARGGRLSHVLPQLVYAASLGWFVLIFRAIWLSAGRYDGPQIWPLIARVGVLAGIGRMAAEAVALEVPPTRRVLAQMQGSSRPAVRASGRLIREAAPPLAILACAAATALLVGRGLQKVASCLTPPSRSAPGRSPRGA
jgi:hypothetical protein